MGRQICADILRKQDDRLIVIVGPCSIHDIDAGLDYCKLTLHVIVSDIFNHFSKLFRPKAQARG
jgi:phospho-2-dehydro-3-deoxyheptonate aldolase